MPVKKVDASIECTVCELVVQVLEKYIEENTTEVRTFVFGIVVLFACDYVYRQRSNKSLKSFVMIYQAQFQEQ